MRKVFAELAFVLCRAITGAFAVLSLYFVAASDLTPWAALFAVPMLVTAWRNPSTQQEKSDGRA